MLSNEIIALIEKMTDLQEKCNLYQYCTEILKLFDFNKEMMSIEDLENYLNQRGELFPVVSTIYQNIHMGNWYILINFIYHFDNLKNNEDLIKKELSINNLLNFNSSDLIWKDINLNVEKLLSINENNRLLTFLFIYFLPMYKERDFDFDFNNGEPNISKLEITNENFQILLYLWNRFSSKRKENIDLLYYFIKNYIYSSKFKSEIIIKSKLEGFFKMGFSTSSIDVDFSRASLNMYSDFFNYIKEQEIICLYNGLNDKLKISNKRKEVSKI